LGAALLTVLVPAFSSAGKLVALADTATPIVEGPTSEATPLATVATVQPAALPTLVREVSTPIATSVVVPTVAPTAVATTIEARQQPTLPATVAPTAVPESAPEPANTLSTAVPPPVVAWPSPQQLRENALLRWGSRVPSSVRRWAFLIVPAARKNHLDPNLVAAVMTMESNGDPTAWSGADARGLMQILHGPWDPQENVYEGAHVLAKLWAAYGDWTLVLAAYNAGPGAVDAYGGVPPYRETRDYVIIVSYLWDLYSHHHLSLARRSLYRRSLSDLQRFDDQRPKVKRLAQIAQVKVGIANACAKGTCASISSAGKFDTLDPFWPLGGAPDPLQRVGPYTRKP
jgi:soluble lytic murein transglycosylase-like protein